MLPNFIIAGTFPAGTGHLFSLLIQHPDVYLPLPMAPECNFFFKTRDYEKGIGCYEERWFSAHEDQAAVGERSSLLLCGPWAAARIKKHLPEVKLIFLFRNPTDRAYANYRFTALAGFEDLGFEEALEAEEDRIARTTDPFWTEIQPHAYFSRGIYHEQLKVYREHFDESQMLLMRSDELLGDLAASILAFVSLLALRLRWAGALGLVWAFNVVGTVDLANAVGRGVIYDAAAGMGATFWIPSLVVPALLVSHALMFMLLLRERRAPAPGGGGPS